MKGYRSVVVAALAAFAVAPAQAQTFPNHAITIVVPYSAGGPTDSAARVIAEPMAAILGQNIIIENVTGGATNIATGRVARSAPDGYTLLIHQLALAANVTFFPNQPFDTAKDLAGVGLVNYSPMILVARKDLPVKTLPDIAAWMKKNGAAVKFAHAGAGSLAHLCAAIFAQAAGAGVTMIPYRGGTPALTDIVAGHADLYCSSPTIGIEQVKAGNVIGFGITAKDKLAAVPEVPSAVALGFKDLDVQFWQGLYAPAGTPKPVLDKLNAALRAALADPKVLKNFSDSGVSAFAGADLTPEAATAKLRQEITRWAEVIRVNKIEAGQ